eukprot:7390457-Prymnesium_polylepis.1
MLVCPVECEPWWPRALFSLHRRRSRERCRGGVNMLRETGGGLRPMGYDAPCGGSVSADATHALRCPGWDEIRVDERTDR